jgi:predicted alternative tryptophan synthase beta-subunit
VLIYNGKKLIEIALGHGYFDLNAYDKFLKGELPDT